MWSHAIDLISMIFNGINLASSTSSSKVQTETLEEIRGIRESILALVPKEQPGVSNLIPSNLWDKEDQVLITPKTILFITGCHHSAEIYDRPIAGALRIAVETLINNPQADFVNSVIISDHWYSRHQESGDWATNHILSIGGPRINTVSESIEEEGEMVYNEGNLFIYKRGNSFAIHGTNSSDTYDAVKIFTKKFLPGYIKSIWD